MSEDVNKDVYGDVEVVHAEEQKPLQTPSGLSEDVEEVSFHSISDAIPEEPPDLQDGPPLEEDDALLGSRHYADASFDNASGSLDETDFDSEMRWGSLVKNNSAGKAAAKGNTYSHPESADASYELTEEERSGKLFRGTYRPSWGEDSPEEHRYQKWLEEEKEKTRQKAAQGDREVRDLSDEELAERVRQETSDTYKKLYASYHDMSAKESIEGLSEKEKQIREKEASLLPFIERLGQSFMFLDPVLRNMLFKEAGHAYEFAHRTNYLTNAILKKIKSGEKPTQMFLDTMRDEAVQLAAWVGMPVHESMEQISSHPNKTPEGVPYMSSNPDALDPSKDAIEPPFPDGTTFSMTDQQATQALLDAISPNTGRGVSRFFDKTKEDKEEAEKLLKKEGKPSPEAVHMMATMGIIEQSMRQLMRLMEILLKKLLNRIAKAFNISYRFKVPDKNDPYKIVHFRRGAKDQVSPSVVAAYTEWAQHTIARRMASKENVEDVNQLIRSGNPAVYEQIRREACRLEKMGGEEAESAFTRQQQQYWQSRFLLLGDTEVPEEFRMKWATQKHHLEQAAQAGQETNAQENRAHESVNTHSERNASHAAPEPEHQPEHQQQKSAQAEPPQSPLQQQPVEAGNDAPEQKNEEEGDRKKKSRRFPSP